MKKKIIISLIVIAAIGLLAYCFTHRQTSTVPGRYPDANLTPGDIDPSVTAQDVCTPGFSTSVRSVPSRIHRVVFLEYGLSYPPHRGAYEVDHFIPLELGGTNDIKNLWPEAHDPSPGFHEKDLVENYLQREVCAGRISLREAQEKIRTDWYAVYVRMGR